MTFIERLLKSVKWAFIINLIILIVLTALFSRAGFYFAMASGMPSFILLTFWFMYMNKKKDRTNNKKTPATPVEYTDFEYQIKTAKNNMVKIKNNVDTINHINLKKEIDEFIINSNKIFEISEEEDYKNISKFFTYCIPTILESLEECNRYNKLNIENEEVESYKTKIYTTVVYMNDVAKEVENICIKRRTNDAELELKTLETLFEVDGFIEKNKE